MCSVLWTLWRYWWTGERFGFESAAGLAGLSWGSTAGARLPVNSPGILVRGRILSGFGFWCPTFRDARCYVDCQHASTYGDFPFARGIAEGSETSKGLLSLDISLRFGLTSD